MDAVDNLVLVGCAEKKFVLYDVANPLIHMLSFESTKMEQIRCVAISPDKSKCAVGSDKGRCSIRHFQQENASKD
jgi:hypothetical protein